MILPLTVIFLSIMDGAGDSVYTSVLSVYLFMAVLAWICLVFRYILSVHEVLTNFSY